MHTIHSKWRVPKSQGTRLLRNRKSVQRLNEYRQQRQTNQNNTASNTTSNSVSRESTDKNTVNSSVNQPSTATEKKLTLFSKDRAVHVDNNQYLVVHITALSNLIKTYFCSSCDQLSPVKINLCQKNGLAVLIQIVCEDCESVVSEAFSSPPVSEKQKAFDVNKKFVDAFLQNGYSGLTSFCAKVNINPMSGSTYYSHLSTIKSEAKMLKVNILARSREAVRKVHLALNPDLQEGAVIDILASFDGSWHKRGHTSLYGLGCVIDAVTGLIVDYEILSKYCHSCTVTMHDLGEDSPEFDVWYQAHKSSSDCGINYQGSSGGMEMAIAEILWKRSEADCKMRYTTLLSGGDSKTLIHLQSLNIYNIEKEECINHVAKRLYSALSDLVKTSKAKKITLGGKKRGALTNKVISRLSNYYRSAVIRNKDNVHAMKKDILATLTHCSSTDDKPNHSDCPKGNNSWCFYNKAIALKKKPQSHPSMQVVLNELVVTHIRPVYDRLTTMELLQRCTRGLTQNANEAVHSIIWRKCPKNTFVSKAKIKIAVANAVAEYNMGHVEASRSKATVTGAAVSSISQKILELKDRKRISDSVRKNEPETKRSRMAKKFSKRQAEKKTVEAEGPTYGAGKF